VRAIAIHYSSSDPNCSTGWHVLGYILGAVAAIFLLGTLAGEYKWYKKAAYFITVLIAGNLVFGLVGFLFLR